MAMSTDRIEFVLTCNERELDNTAAAAAKAFGMAQHEARSALKKDCGTGTRIRCRPSQFGRFIVYRVEEGVECNRIKELRPKLLTFTPDSVLDVSMRPKSCDD